MPASSQYSSSNLEVSSFKFVWQSCKPCLGLHTKSESSEPDIAWGIPDSAIVSSGY